VEEALCTRPQTEPAADRYGNSNYNIITLTLAALSYSARRYDSAVCYSKMSCDAFLSEALYEADKALEKFTAALRESACLHDSGWSRQ